MESSGASPAQCSFPLTQPLWHSPSSPATGPLWCPLGPLQCLSPGHAQLRVAFLKITRVSLGHIQPHVLLGAIMVSPGCSQPHVPPVSAMVTLRHAQPGAIMVLTLLRTAAPVLL